MYILTIVRYDINHGEMDIFLPMKVPTRSMCEETYIDVVKEDKQYLLKDYEDEEYVEENFEYNHRIDELDGLLHINKHHCAN
jgi:hypothetical protein